MLQDEIEIYVTLRQSNILPQGLRRLSASEGFFSRISYLHIRYRLLECSIHEKSLSAYVIAGKFPHSSAQPIWGRIYIVIQTDYFVVSQLFCVARTVKCFKTKSEPDWLNLSKISYPIKLVSLILFRRHPIYIYIYIYIIIFSISPKSFFFYLMIVVLRRHETSDRR